MTIFELIEVLNVFPVEVYTQGQLNVFLMQVKLIHIVPGCIVKFKSKGWGKELEWE